MWWKVWCHLVWWHLFFFFTSVMSCIASPLFMSRYWPIPIYNTHTITILIISSLTRWPYKSMTLMTEPILLTSCCCRTTSIWLICLLFYPLRLISLKETSSLDYSSNQTFFYVFNALTFTLIIITFVSYLFLLSASYEFSSKIGVKICTSFALFKAPCDWL